MVEIVQRYPGQLDAPIARPRTSMRRFMRRRSTVAFLMCLPLIVIVAALIVYPAFYSIYLATLSKAQTKFVGLGNFTYLLKRDTFWMVVEQSAIFAISAVFFKALIGLITAHLVNNLPAKGQRKWRGMLLVPWVIPLALSSLGWWWLFDPTHSALNWVIRGFGGNEIPWLSDPYWARFSVILVNVWYGAPFFLIMYLAALKSVPEQLYEAASIDGANAWQKFIHIRREPAGQFRFQERQSRKICHFRTSRRIGFRGGRLRWRRSAQSLKQLVCDRCLCLRRIAVQECVQDFCSFQRLVLRNEGLRQRQARAIGQVFSQLQTAFRLADRFRIIRLSIINNG